MDLGPEPTPALGRNLESEPTGIGEGNNGSTVQKWLDQALNQKNHDFTALWFQQNSCCGEKELSPLPGFGELVSHDDCENKWLRSINLVCGFIVHCCLFMQQQEAKQRSHKK